MGCGGQSPPPKRGDWGQSPQLGNTQICDGFSYVSLLVFLHFTTYLPHPKPPLSQHVLFRLLGVLMDFDSPHP